MRGDGMRCLTLDHSVMQSMQNMCLQVGRMATSRFLQVLEGVAVSPIPLRQIVHTRESSEEMSRALIDFRVLCAIAKLTK